MSSNNRAKRPETRTMVLARYRNQLEERSLGRRLEVLGNLLRGRCNKLRVEMGQLEENLKMMSPLAGKPVVCPKGLTESEKEEYLKLRRNSYTPSMTLEEFDVRLTDFRHVMTTYRRKSLPANQEDAVVEDAGIVDLGGHAFCAPLTKHKHTMKEALKRAAATPPATDLSPHLAASTVFKSRAFSESSAAGMTDIAAASTAPVHPSRSKNVHRSVSHPGQGSGPHEPRSVAVVPSASGDVSRPSGRPSTACSRSPSGLRSGRAEQSGSRCKSASAGRRESRRQEIVICPDYVVARRMSVTAAGVDFNKE